jgi:hypothetical protein
MSIQQRNDPRVITVDRPTAEVLRSETLVVLESNSHHFDDVERFSAAGRRAVRAVYADAFAVLDAVGWGGAGADGREAPPPPAPVAVPLTAGHMAQLRGRRRDLGHLNLDRLSPLAAEPPDPAAIDATRRAAQALDRLQSAFTRPPAPAA